MIYLTTNSDGVNTEGIGAMAQYQLFCFALAKQLNVNFLFTGFKNLQHWQYYNIDQQTFVADVNKFFNFPIEEVKKHHSIKLETIDQKILQLIDSKKDLIIELTPAALMQHGQRNIKNIEKNNWIKDLQSNILIDQSNIDASYNKSAFNVAIHIRKYTQTDCDPAHIRDLYDTSKQEYYQNLIKDISEIYAEKSLQIHIYSQGEESEFAYLKDIGACKFHIEEYPLTSLYSMIHSDVFFMSNSSLSYIASLYRTNTTYKKSSFYHSTYTTNVRLISPEGKIK